MKEFKNYLTISYGRLKFWKSQKNPNFGTFCVGSFWKCDIEKVIFPEFYRASFGFLIKNFLIFFWFSKNLVFETWKKTYYPLWPFRPFCHDLPKQSETYISLYIHIYIHIYIYRERYVSLCLGSSWQNGRKGQSW